MRVSEFNGWGTAEKLKQWGKWCASAGYHELGYEEVDLSCRAGMPLLITDDMAAYIDRGVARLKRKEEILAKMLIYYYVGNKRQSDVAERFDVSRKMIGGYIRRAEAWMDCYFEMKPFQEHGMLKTG